MIQFIEDLKGYIQKCFDDDEKIEQKISVCDAFKSNLVKCPKVVVYCVDDSEEEQYNTFSGEEVSSVSVQITCYAEQMRIGGVTKSAQDCANYFCEKIRDKFQKTIISSNLPSVLQIRRVGRTYAIPFDSGERMYMSPIRYEIQVENKK